MEYETTRKEEDSLIYESMLKDRIDRLWEYYGRANAKVIRYDYRRKGEV